MISTAARPRSLITAQFVVVVLADTERTFVSAPES
jgi:hypothetical protein